MNDEPKHQDIDESCFIKAPNPKPLPPITDPVVLALSKESRRKKRKSWLDIGLDDPTDRI
jgi:hypothetical protein